MKRIIICCDGAWNNPGQKAVSNVVKVSRALRPLAGGVAQVVFYGFNCGQPPINLE